jgi:hypothetical protein
MSNKRKIATAGVVAVIIVTIFGLSVSAYHLSRANKRNIAESPSVQPRDKVAKQEEMSKLPEPPAAVITQKSGATLIFQDLLNGPDRIVTNGYAHFSKNSCSIRSDKWDVSSGTLMIRGGVGYSGVPTDEEHSICHSESATNSYIFRMTARTASIGNAVTSFDYMLKQHGGGGGKVNSYDGVHLWLGYQDETALYAVSVGRWDHRIVVKKKTPTVVSGCTDPANGGCYEDISNIVSDATLTAAGVWHHVAATKGLDSAGNVTIGVVIDGVNVLNVVDKGAIGAPYKTGQVGIRGDNTEFYLKNFTVMSK